MGFTAIEVVIVVIILGILTALATPMLNASLVDARLSAATSEVVTAIEYAQLSAMNTGRPCRVSIESTTDTLKVEQLTYTGIATILDPGTSSIAEATIETNVTYAVMDYPPNPGISYSVNLSLENVDITASDIGTATPLLFSAGGAPSSAASITLSHGGRTKLIVVDSLTGRVSFSG